MKGVVLGPRWWLGATRLWDPTPGPRPSPGRRWWQVPIFAGDDGCLVGSRRVEGRLEKAGIVYERLRFLGFARNDILGLGTAFGAPGMAWGMGPRHPP